MTNYTRYSVEPFNMAGKLPCAGVVGADQSAQYRTTDVLDVHGHIRTLRNRLVNSLMSVDYNTIW